MRLHRSSKFAKSVIHHADAISWLSTRRSRSVHAVVTDPPYGVSEYLPDELEKRAEGRGLWRLPQAYDGYARTSMPRFTVMNEVERSHIASLHHDLAPALLRTLVPGGHVIMASHNLFSYVVVDAFVNAGFELRGEIARIVRTLRGGDRPKGAHDQYPDVSVTPRSCWEPWLIFRKPVEGRVRDNLARWRTGALRRPSRDTPFMDLIVAGPARGEERRIAPHPSIKPQILMRQLVSAALPMGTGVVLDPFMGSGSTIAAATALGISSIGVERNADYYLLAKAAIPRLSELEVAITAIAPRRERIRKQASEVIATA